MNIHLKSYIIILITLLIGMAIGALSFRAIARYTGCIAMGPGQGMMRGPGMGPGSGMGPGPGMMRGFHRGMGGRPDEFIKDRMKFHINPSDEQWSKIEPLLDEHIKKFRKSMDTHRKEIKELMDSIEKDLSPHLTDDQRETLKAIKERRKGMIRPKDWGPGRWKEMKKRRMEMFSDTN
ncbi:MAG: hypothetical protein ACYTEU_09450 [Planctomycetota bacterium]|jgi:hypothetical protein